MAPLLEVKKLKTTLSIEKKTYLVVREISFSIEPGQTVALVGETGCGKSMTALSIMGIAPSPPVLPIEGEIFYKGVDLLTLSKQQMRQIRGRYLAMIFQDPRSALNPVLPIGEQLIETCLAHLAISLEEARAKALAVLQEVHLPYAQQLMGQYPHQLSGGMLQRVMIAMALICEPDILIADEPTTALDVTTQKQILDLLKEIQKNRAMGMLLITHDMGVVQQLADEIIVLYAGQIIEQGEVAQVFQNPAHPYTQALFSSRPHRPLKEGRLPTIEGSVPSLKHMPTGCLFHPRCRYCMEQCKNTSPPNFNLPTIKQQVKCFLFDPLLEWKIDESTSI